MPGQPPPWFDEIDLSPDRQAVTMGTRSLQDRPWLVADDQREAELALKAELASSRHSEVFAAVDGSEAAGQATLDLVVSTGIVIDASGDLHPLERVGRCVQEDLCLMHRRDDGWYLEAASLNFPSRWTLTEKLGRHMTEIHGPVTGYEERLAKRVDSFMDRLSDRPVWRRNWFIHSIPDLFQPGPPAGGDPLIPADAALNRLMMRSERQTLRNLRVEGWILFTIRVQQAPLDAFVAHPERAAALDTYISTAPPAELTHRGINAEQATELRLALAELKQQC